jgi:uncharacterized protein (DUF4415 family)
LHLSFHSFIYVFDKWLISLTLNKEKRMKIKLPKEGLTTSEIVQAYGQEKESDVLQTVLEMIQRKEAHLHGSVVLPGSRRPGRPRAATLRVPITVRLPEDMVSKIRASGNATRYIEDAVKMKMSKETSQK